MPDEARDAAARLLADGGWDGRAPLVALAPGAAYGGAKRWPPASFAELADSLAMDGMRCVMIGGAADAATGRAILGALGGATRSSISSAGPTCRRSPASLGVLRAGS